MHGRSPAGLAVVAAALIAIATSAPAGVVQTGVSGNLGAAENSCNHVIFVLSGAGCTYGNDRPGVAGWAGPTFAAGHYALGSAGDSTAHFPSPGDGKVAPAVSGTVTIDDNGTPGKGTDDTIAAILVIGSAARNVFTGNSRIAVERWASLTHTLAATPVSAGTPNALGGFDYVIGLQGFPSLLCAAGVGTDCFASENAPGGIPTPGFWSGPEASGVGIERNANQGGNAGATTTAVFQAYSCSDMNLGSDCLSSNIVWGAGEDPGFDNLLLRIVTNGAGQLVSADGYWTQEFRFAFSESQPGDNSWIGGTLSLSAQVVPIPAAGWLLGSAFAGLAWLRRRSPLIERASRCGRE